VLPAWLASIMQVPVPLKETTPPAIEQTAPAELSMVNVTGLPEAPPVAVTV
jgi:hypothetical protein